MVIITKSGEIINFDNIISITRHGKNIIAHTVVDTSLPLASYDDAAEANEMLKQMKEAFLKEKIRAIVM